MSNRLDFVENGRAMAESALLSRDKDAEQMSIEDYEAGLRDALANLMHFADRYSIDFDDELQTARLQHRYEKRFAWDEEQEVSL